MNEVGVGRNRSALALVLAALAVAGCEGLATRDASRTEAEARADDAHCTKAGHAFPSPSYTSCRYQLAAKRQSDTMRELQLGTSMAAPEWQFDRQLPPPEGREELDPERFTCVARGEGPTRLVLCGEK